MPRPTTGGMWRDASGKLYARVSYTDAETGTRKDRKMLVESGSETDFMPTLMKLMQRVESEKQKPKVKVDKKRPRTYGELVERYMKEVAFEAKYDASGVKLEGMRSWYPLKSQLSHSLRKFGRMKYERITYTQLKQWRMELIQMPVERTPGVKTERSLACVNRTLTAMQGVIRWALEKGWMGVSPFTMGERLVKTSAEKPRQRILSREECERLLSAARSHPGELATLVTVLMGTGARLSEARRLEWGDVDFQNRTLRLYSYKGRLRRERRVPMTGEVFDLLARMRNESRRERVFNFTTTLWKTFTLAVEEADLGERVRFHDLRHTYATRLIKGGLSAEHTGKLLGHASPMMTYRYIGVDEEVRTRAAEILEGQ